MVTRGRGGTVLANLRWILMLMASGTGFPRDNDFSMDETWERLDEKCSVDLVCDTLVSCSKAARNSRLNTSRSLSACLNPASILPSCASSQDKARCTTFWMCSVLNSLRRLRL